MNGKRTFGVLLFAAGLLACGGEPGGAASTLEGAATSTPSKMTGKELWNESEKLFADNRVHAVSLDMRQGDWNQMHDDERCAATGNQGNKAGARWWHVDSLTVDGKVFHHAAVKIKGNTSRCIPRVQLSVRLDKTSGVFSDGKEVKYDDAQKAEIKANHLHGLTEFSLRRSANDTDGNGMLAREPLGSWAYAQTEDVLAKTTVRGAPVYRTAYATVEFQFDHQSAFTRAYLVAETIDASFLKMRYDDEAPTAFSLSLGCGLQLNGGKHAWSEACLDPEVVRGKGFKPEDEADVRAMFDGPNGLVTRIQAIDASGPGAADQVKAVLDLDSFLNYATAATVLGHWDSAYGNFNNDVLYRDASGKWKIIAWDLDNTLDFDNPLGRPDRPFDYATPDRRRAVFDKILAIEPIRQMLRDRIRTYLGKLFVARDRGPIFDELSGDVKPRVQSMIDGLDPFEKVDLARSQEMTDYLSARFDSLVSQIR